MSHVKRNWQEYNKKLVYRGYISVFCKRAAEAAARLSKLLKIPGLQT